MSSPFTASTTPRNEDDHDLQAGQQRAGGPVDTPGRARALSTARKSGRSSLNLPSSKALPAEGAHHADPGEVFLHHGGELALGLVRDLEARGDAAVEEPELRATTGMKAKDTRESFVFMENMA